MPYQKEMLFLQQILKKCNLQMITANPEALADRQVDLGLRQILGIDERYRKIAVEYARSLEGQTVYRLKDPFDCRYLFFLLPDGEEKRLVVVGPYLNNELTHEMMMEQAERHGIDPQWFRMIEKYFSAVPVLSDDSPVFAALDAFAELIWGKDNYTVADMGTDPSAELISGIGSIPSDPVEMTWMMEELERRYARENEMLQAVAQGQLHKAEMLMTGFTSLSFERRLADPVRNLKNYCIIMNTLLRKAAEYGGVHPLYLDRLSSDFARRIEALSALETVQKLMEEMFRSYCRLVSKNSSGQYSPPVQKAIMHIDVNLDSELNLKLLAGIQNMNASYLSALFKKETGQTLTDFINQKRIRQAEQLLAATKLQVQTVAQHCGISDVNYFSKLFKKYTGRTPNEYRKEEQRARLQKGKRI